MSTELKIVMFTDQVDSTANTTLRTNAEIVQVALEQDDLTNEVLRVTDGVLLKDTGDGAFAQFSAVLQAVQAGVLLQQRVAERNAAQRNNRLHFDLHIGIDVGELVVLANGELRGEAANRCARICSECPPGEVYISDAAAGMLNQNEVDLEALPTRELKGLKGATRVYRVRALHVQPESAPNPFVWRSGVTAAANFFDREEEQRTLRSYLHGRQNCQIVGPHCIGKTPLLRQVERAAVNWNKHTVVAYLDPHDPRCYSLAGWLSEVSQQCHWSTPATTLNDFAARIVTTLEQGLHPVLCLDEFEELTMRPDEFTRNFFLALRSCGEKGMSIVTASRKPLSELFDPSDKLVSPFYTAFRHLPLGPFQPADAEDFVNIYRPGTPAFTPDEKGAILDFANGHPLALQIACYHVLDAKNSGSISAAIIKAADEMRVILPRGW
ncbi:MAG TPA: hypothetical protein VK582_01090 [Pyrinomonadaceae bacterium]|nr:hypothetical protein [Pyrinomonadaceae bacterium]